MCRNVVLFTGTHWFLDESLPRLATIMRTPGGARVPDDLRALIQDRIVFGSEDPRLHPDFDTLLHLGSKLTHMENGIVDNWRLLNKSKLLHVVIKKLLHSLILMDFTNKLLIVKFDFETFFKVRFQIVEDIDVLDLKMLVFL